MYIIKIIWDSEMGYAPKNEMWKDTEGVTFVIDTNSVKAEWFFPETLEECDQCHWSHYEIQNFENITTLEELKNLLIKIGNYQYGKQPELIALAESL